MAINAATSGNKTFTAFKALAIGGGGVVETNM